MVLLTVDSSTTETTAKPRAASKGLITVPAIRLGYSYLLEA